MNPSTTRKGRENMQTKYGRMLGIMACVAAAFILAAPAWAGVEVFMAGANLSGDAVYMRLNDADFSFSSLQVLQKTAGSGITDYPWTFGNGIGDFNKDGHYDYIMGIGYGMGGVYISAGDGNRFGPPQRVASWNEDYKLEGFLYAYQWPMDIAVGDFNGDGKQDFVMSYNYSAKTGLYLGDGNFGFTYSALLNTAPSLSAGIDAADFNGDGFDDFVVAPNTDDEPIYVNINKRDGTFRQKTFKPINSNVVYGIAVGYFNDDAIVDIVTASEDFLILYTGSESVTEDGEKDVTFAWAATYDLELNQSAIDNYDVDGDGDEDLVVASYDSDISSIAILLNDGNGAFTLHAIYPGGVGELYAVSAPPYVPKSNAEPVAQLAAYTYEATVGDAIEFDGTQSYDDDGDSLTFQWDFGDGSPIVEGDAAKLSHTYNEPDTYIVTLTVIDDKDAMNSVQAEVHVSAIAASVAFYPYLLDLHSRDKWITASIRVPSGLGARQIDVSTVQIVFEGETIIAADLDQRFGFFGFIHKLFRKNKSSNTLNVKFNQRALSKALAGTSGNTLLKLAGKIDSNGNMVDFSGEGAVKVVGKHKKIAHHGNKHGWK